MQAKNAALSSDFTKLFEQFAIPGFPIDSLVSAHRRNFEAVAAATQVAAESWQTVFRRQFEIFSQIAADGSSGLHNFWSLGGAPGETIAQNADVAKVTFEKCVTNFREVSDILAKANVEASDVLAKRVAEGLTEWQGTVAKAPLAA